MGSTGRFRRSERAAAIAVGVTVVLAVLKFVVWGVTGSLAVLSQALDSLLDVVALGLVFLGVRIANLPADDSHHYGHAKAENLAAFAQTVIIAAVVFFVAVEAVGRLGNDDPSVTAPWYALLLLGVSMVVDGARVAYLLATVRAERSDALKAGAVNIAGDLGTAAVALVSLALVRTGTDVADPVGALLVGAIVLYVATKVARRSIDVLMDRAPRTATQDIERAAAGADGVLDTKRVRVRGTADNLFADVTVTTGRTYTLERAHDIAEAVEREVARVAPGADVVVHVEPEDRTGGLVEKVQAAASKTPDIHEVHNVLVHAFQDGGGNRLHVTLHAKIAADSSLSDSHDAADRIEEAIRAELGEDVRVDAHIEPLVSTSLGSDVTGNRSDIVQAVEEVAAIEVDIVDCHEVIVTNTSGELRIVAHVTGRADLPLQRIHDASERIENELHNRFSEVSSVVLHFEPR